MWAQGRSAAEFAAIAASQQTPVIADSNRICYFDRRGQACSPGRNRLEPMNRWIRWAALGVAGVVIFGLGFSLGVRQPHPLWDTFVTQGYMKTRLAQCATTLRLHTLAEPVLEGAGPESDESRQLALVLAGELATCNTLIVSWPNKIGDEDRATADRIVSTYRQVQQETRQRSAP